jgi:hypothetical protein
MLFDGTIAAPTAAPPEPWDIPILEDTEIVAQIGPSGGLRGVGSITGQPSWGIAWFLNGNLIPQMVMRRGTKYTIRVSGGSDPSMDSLYHPFYLTTSSQGGYQQLSPEDRLTERPLAGIEILEVNETGVYNFEPTAVGPICSYEVTPESKPNELGSYSDWISTIDMSCAEDAELTSAAGTITFTPDNTTPDVIFYHCVTHFNLGWEILVLDEGDDVPVAEGALEGLTSVLLEGQLQGSTLDYVVIEGDDRAGGRDTVTMIYVVPSEAWAAVGFNNNGGFMPGSEAVIGLPEEGLVQKYVLSDRTPGGVAPMPEEQQTLIDASIEQVDGSTILRFTKILVEEGEIPIVIGENMLLGAYGLSNTLSAHKARESIILNLVSGGSGSLTTRDQILWKAHGWCAAIAWGGLAPLAIGAAICRRLFAGGMWLTIHRSLNSLVLFLTIISLALAVAAINKETPSGFDANHFNPDPYPHRTIGLVLAVVAVFQTLSGILRPHVPEIGEEKSTTRKVFEIGHRVLGLSLLGLSWYQVQSGIKIYQSIFAESTTNLIAVFWGIAAGIAGLVALGFVKIKLCLEPETGVAQEVGTSVQDVLDKEEP